MFSTRSDIFGHTRVTPGAMGKSVEAVYPATHAVPIESTVIPSADASNDPLSDVE